MPLLLAASLLSSTLCGYLVMRIFLPVYTPMWADWALKVCLGAAFGAGITSCLFFLVRLIIGPSTLMYVTAELLLLAGAALAFWFARSTLVIEKPEAWPSGWRWLLLVALIGSIAIAVSLFADGSTGNPYGGWDAWAIWNLRARFLAQPDALWRRAFSSVFHPEYPLFLSGYVARCWTLMNSIGDTAAPISTAALFAGATLGLIVSALAILRGWSTAMISGLILLGTSQFPLVAPWQYADVPLAFYYLAGFALLFLADDVEHHEPRGRMIVLAGLAMGFAAWTKDEGLLFTLVLSIAFLGYVIMAGNLDRAKAFRMFGIGAALPVAMVLCFRLFLAPPMAHRVTIAGATHQLVEGQRYLQTAGAFWNEGIVMGSGIAHPLISLVILGVCLGIPAERRRKPVVIASSIALLAMFASYFFAYILTPMDLAWHISTSLGRLYVQLWPSFIFVSLATFGTADDFTVKEQPQQREELAAPVRRGKKGRNQAAA